MALFKKLTIAENLFHRETPIQNHPPNISEKLIFLFLIYESQEKLQLPYGA